MGNTLAVSVVDSAEALAPLRDTWNRLLGNSRARSICLCWEWLHTWWEIYGDGAALHILLVQEAGRTVGIAPFYRQERKRFGFLRFRTLRFLGTGEPEREEVASEYLDLIAQEGYEKRVADAVWQYLRGTRSWDQLVLNDVLENALAMTALRQRTTQEGFPALVDRTGIRYVIELPRTWSDYLAMLEPGVAKRLPYKRRKLERAGRVADGRISAPQELERAFDELIRLHTLRWTARGWPGVFASRRFVAYHRKLTSLLLPLGMLNIRLLSLDGVNIAVLYNFRYGGTDYFYQGGFDAKDAAKYSPGVMAHVYAIESAMADGLARYDFMKGGTVSYKAEFGCTESPLYDMRVFARTVRGRLLALEARARDRLRPVRQRLKRRADAGATTGKPTAHEAKRTRS